MMPRGLRVLGAALGAILLIDVAATPLRAQALPSSGDMDLTLPPDMRNGAPPSVMARPAPAMRQGRDPAHRHRDPKAANRTEAKAAPKPSGDPHPVELGVTMRGGSGTSRVFAPSGDSEAIQEGGSAFGAGMKFGF